MIEIHNQDIEMRKFPRNTAKSLTFNDIGVYNLSICELSQMDDEPARFML